MHSPKFTKSSSKYAALTKPKTTIILPDPLIAEQNLVRELAALAQREAAEKEETAKRMYTSGFASWQLASGRFNTKNNHKTGIGIINSTNPLFNSDLSYETWEEHFDDEGTLFYFNPATEVSQWDAPRLVRDAILKEKGGEDELSLVPSNQSVNDEDDEEGYYDDFNNWITHGGYYTPRGVNYIEDKQYCLNIEPASEPLQLLEVGGGGRRNNDAVLPVPFAHNQRSLEEYRLGDKESGESREEDDSDYISDSDDDSEEDDDDDDDFDSDEFNDEFPSAPRNLPPSKQRKDSTRRWALLKNVERVMSEISRTSNSDDNQVQKEERLALASLLSNRLISNVINSAVPKYALHVKKEWLRVLKDEQRVIGKSSKAEYLLNRIVHEKVVLEGSLEYLEMHNDDLNGSEEDGKDDKWEILSIPESEEEEKMSTKANDNNNKAELTLDGIIATLTKAGCRSRKLAKVMLKLSQSGAGGRQQQQQQQQALKEVNLTHENIGDIGAVVLSTLLLKASIRKLALVNCGIGDGGVKAISSTFLKNKSLIELYLNSNNITDAGVKALTRTLGGSRNLKVLNLSSNCVTEVGARDVGLMICGSNCRLEVLFVSGGFGVGIGLERKTHAIQQDKDKGKEVNNNNNNNNTPTRPKPSTLTVIQQQTRETSQTSAKIGFIGCIHICAALISPTCPPLKHLTLVNCDINLDGCRALSVMLMCEGCKLEGVDVSSNSFGDDGALLLKDAVTVNKRLRSLNVKNCYVSSRLETEIYELISLVSVSMKTTTTTKRGEQKNGAHNNEASTSRNLPTSSESELGWIKKKEIARVAVGNRKWMLKIAKENGFAYGSTTLHLDGFFDEKVKIEREERRLADGACLRKKVVVDDDDNSGNDKEMNAVYIDNTGVQRLPLELQNFKTKTLDIGSYGSYTEEMKRSILDFDLNNIKCPVCPVKTATGSEKEIGNRSQIKGSQIESTVVIELLDLIATVNSNANAHIAEKKEDLKAAIVKVKSLKLDMKGQDDLHIHTETKNNALANELTIEITNLEVNVDAIRCDLDDKRPVLLRCNEDIDGTEGLVEELAMLMYTSKETKETLGSYEDCGEKVKSITMGGAIGNARRRSLRRIELGLGVYDDDGDGFDGGGFDVTKSKSKSLTDSSQGRSIEKEKEDDVITTAKEKEPDILKAAKSRLNALRINRDMNLIKVSELTIQLQLHNANLAQCYEQVKACNDATKSSCENLESFNERFSREYEQCVGEVDRINGSINECKGYVETLRIKSSYSRVELLEKLEYEEFYGMVTESCGVLEIDDLLRRTLLDSKRCDVRLEQKVLSFNEIDTLYQTCKSDSKGHVEGIEGIKRGREIAEYDKSRNEGVYNDGALAKGEFDKVKTEKRKIESVYGAVVSPELLQRFNEAEDKLKNVNERVDASDKLIKSGTFEISKHQRALDKLNLEFKDVTPVYNTSFAELTDIRENDERITSVLCVLENDYKLLLKANIESSRTLHSLVVVGGLDLDINNTINSSDDKKPNEGLEKYARRFNAAVYGAARVCLCEDLIYMKELEEQNIEKAKKDDAITLERNANANAIALSRDIEKGTVAYRKAVNIVRRKKHLAKQEERKNEARLLKTEKKEREKAVKGRDDDDDDGNDDNDGVRSGGMGEEVERVECDGVKGRSYEYGVTLPPIKN